MNTLIIGSGFGVYGYLPSIIRFSKKIYLNYKYKKKVENRKSLKKYFNRVVWYLDIKSIINRIDYVVIAQKPKNQHDIIKDLLKFIKPKHLFLEKPISNSPASSLKLIRLLNKKKIKFSIGYLFRYLEWYKFTNKSLTQNQKFKIIWEIKINNKNNLWKYNHSEGGGLIRFYAIHFIRLLFDFKITQIKKKIVNNNQWYVKLSDKRNNFFVISLKFSKQNRFEYHLNKKRLFKSSNPFLKRISKNNDPRIKIIKNYLGDALKRYNTNYNYEKKFILFWKELEK